jgi:ribosomal subunit interface protein
LFDLFSEYIAMPPSRVARDERRQRIKPPSQLQLQAIMLLRKKIHVIEAKSCRRRRYNHSAHPQTITSISSSTSVRRPILPKEYQGTIKGAGLATYRVRPNCEQHAAATIDRRDRLSAELIYSRYPMDHPLELSFRNISPSEELKVFIRKCAARMEHHHQHIIGCQVTVEHSEATDAIADVNIDIQVPGENLLVRNQSGGADDVLAAIDQAFDSAARQIEEYKERKMASPANTAGI